VLMDIPPEEIRRMLERLRPMSPNLFAKKVLKSVEKNQAIIIVPAWWKVFWWINRLSPSFGIRLAQRHFQYSQKKFAIPSPPEPQLPRPGLNRHR
jgi:short-subunit dehydrogenase